MLEPQLSTCVCWALQAVLMGAAVLRVQDMNLQSEQSATLGL